MPRRVPAAVHSANRVRNAPEPRSCTDNRPADASTPDVDSPDDRLTRFLIDGAGVRGVLVHLQDTWKDIGACAVDASRQAPAAVELLGEEEALAAAADGDADIRCEFCGRHYRFSEGEIRGLLALSASEVQAPDRLQ